MANRLLELAAAAAVASRLTTPEEDEEHWWSIAACCCCCMKEYNSCSGEIDGIGGTFMTSPSGVWLLLESIVVVNIHSFLNIKWRVRHNLI